MEREVIKAIKVLNEHCNETDCKKCEIKEIIGCRVKKGEIDHCVSPYMWD